MKLWKITNKFVDHRLSFSCILIIEAPVKIICRLAHIFLRHSTPRPSIVNLCCCSGISRHLSLTLSLVDVYKVVRCDANDDRTVIDAGYIGMYNRYDKVPKEVWSAHVYTVGAEAEDVLSVMIEDEK